MITAAGIVPARKPGEPGDTERDLPMRISLRNSVIALLGAAAVASAGTVIGTAAASAGKAVTVQHLSVTASASGISDHGVTRLDPELTVVSMRNRDTGEHALHLVRLRNGVTLAQFENTLRSGDMAAVGKIITWYGGVNSVPPGKIWSMSIKLAVGEYALLDSGQRADGSPNFAHPGFIKSLRVAGDPATAPPPAANVHVNQVDFAFHMPARLPRDATLEITNTGAQPHEMDFLLLDPGVTVQQALQALAHHQEPPGKEIDVLTAFSPGLTAWVPLHLTPGTYLVVSFFPDVAHGGIPQAAEGMVGSFTVN